MHLFIFTVLNFIVSDEKLQFLFKYNLFERTTHNFIDLNNHVSNIYVKFLNISLLYI